MSRVLIIAVPPGEAPVAVRQAWVGLILPLAPEFRNGPVELSGYGVLSRLRTTGSLFRLWRRLVGRPALTRQYAVPVDEAVALLAEVAPEAAQWWRDNTPYLFGVGDRFCFAAEVCEEVT